MDHYSKDDEANFIEGLYDNANDQLKEVYKEQQQNRDNLLKEIANVMLTYTVADTVMNLSKDEQDKLSSKFLNLITGYAKVQGTITNKTTTDILNNTVSNTYKFYSYNANHKDVKEIIDNNYKGKHFSSRVWDNEQAVAELLHSQTQDFLKGKVNVNQIKKLIHDTYDNNAYEVRRLVETEVNRCEDEAFRKFCKETGVKKVIRNEVLDAKTCTRCAALDGKPFDLDKAPGVVHPLCRGFNTIANDEKKDNMSGVTNSTIWPAKGAKISKEELKDLKNYAKDKGIALSEFKNFDGDIDLVKQAIDDMSEIVSKYPKISNGSNKLTLRPNYYMEDEDFAQARGHILDINGKAFRNKELLENEYSKLSEDGWFTPNTSYRAIVKHEMGHVVHDTYNINTISIGKDILGIKDNKELFELLESKLSRYSSDFSDGSEILSEVFAEFYDSRKPREFSLKFMEKLDKLK
ncbi:hypothetical protein [Clostridium beijerinckii]|uniref:Phage Mu protein F like protein n=1 Tax=Clostridium beijerinckii TaxID=1520 RepID=A0AAX0B6G4_CLOBE|nr:hypothetical protein [Clostridium beijerinckii]NRT90038.1 hypothetical protein [Clostridium beijerinckii]NYC69569.1 hypothetical protein [Clostridium beijerinckii]